MVEKIYEIRIRKVEELSKPAQREVNKKLEEIKEPFNFQGYAKIVYTHISPMSPIQITNVDPIEGTITNYFKEILKHVN